MRSPACDNRKTGDVWPKIEKLPEVDEKDVTEYEDKEMERIQNEKNHVPGAE